MYWIFKIKRDNSYINLIEQDLIHSRYSINIRKCLIDLKKVGNVFINILKRKFSIPIKDKSIFFSTLLLWKEPKRMKIGRGGESIGEIFNEAIKYLQVQTTKWRIYATEI